jgi:hypothetical protein
MAAELNVIAPGMGLMVGPTTLRRWMSAANPFGDMPFAAIFLGLAAMLLVVVGFATIPIWVVAVFLVLGGLGLIVQGRRR